MKKALWTEQELHASTPKPTLKEIKLELVETNVFTRWPCYACGGFTEKEPVLAEVTKEGEYKGFRVCENCMKDRDFDAKLTAQAEALEQGAAYLRAAVGRLQVPTFQEWQEACRHCEQKFEKAEPDDDADEMFRAAYTGTLRAIGDGIDPNK